jgi:hypothetical protein
MMHPGSREADRVKPLHLPALCGIQRWRMDAAILNAEHRQPVLPV